MKSIRTKLADAHQACRDALNKNHELQQLHLPLRERISELERQLEAARAALAQVPKFLSYERERLSDAELYALAALVHTESLTATPARERLLREIEARGVVVTVEQATILENIKRASGG